MWQGKLDESVYFWLIGVFDYSAVPFQRKPVKMHSFCLKYALKSLEKFRCNVKFEEKNKKIDTDFDHFWHILGLLCDHFLVSYK